jgi:hypothetical protein
MMASSLVWLTELRVFGSPELRSHFPGHPGPLSAYFIRDL